MTSENPHSNIQPVRDPSLAEELGVGDSLDPVFSARGRLFSTAGPLTPIAEFTDDYLLLYPPQKPFEDGLFAEDISIRIDEQGVLLNELGKRRSIPGAKFHGQSIFCLAERSASSGKHLVAWFDDLGNRHKLFFQGTELSIHDAFKARNATHDGEIAIFPELSSD